MKQLIKKILKEENLKSELSGIIKFIESMYNPSKIKIDAKDVFGNEETYVSLYFDKISDDYISNPQSGYKQRLKERNLNLEIRNDVYKYFGVMTSGLDLNGYSPYRYNGLTIDVHLIN